MTNIGMHICVLHAMIKYLYTRQHKEAARAAHTYKCTSTVRQAKPHAEYSKQQTLVCLYIICICVWKIHAN